MFIEFWESDMNMIGEIEVKDYLSEEGRKDFLDASMLYIIKGLDIEKEENEIERQLIFTHKEVSNYPNVPWTKGIKWKYLLTEKRITIKGKKD